MRSMKKVISCCAAVCILLSAFAIAQAKNNGEQAGKKFELPDTTSLEISTNRHTQYDGAASETRKRLTTEGFELKISNDRLEVWYRAQTQGIRIVDLKNGYVWGCLESDKVEGMNTTWCAMANSLCTVEYFNSDYADSRISLSDPSAKTEYKWENSTMHCNAYFQKISIGFSFTLSLLEDGFSIQMDKDSLEEKGDFTIKSLYFLPFFGCVRENEINGYLFVPDGSGALIRFGSKGDYVSGYEDKVYGLDMGIDTLTQASDLQASRTNDYLIDSSQITMPVFGISHSTGNNAVLGIIEGGELNASILALPAGFTTDYYWTTARFNFRQLYVESTGTDGKGVYTAAKKPEDITPAVRYILFQGENADYSGMAVAYREYLQKKGMLNKERIDSQIPLRLDVIGSEIKEGIIFNSTGTFTTTNQAQGFVKSLKEDGIKNLTMVYEGWQKGGINGSKYASTAFNTKVGSSGDFEKLKDFLESNGGRFYLQANPVTANKDQINIKEDASITVSNSISRFVRPNTNVMYADSYILKPSLILQTLKKYTSALKEYPMSYQQLGSRVYSDYTRAAALNRREAAEKIIESVKENTQPVALSLVNQYLWQYTDEYFDIPTANSQYLFETDSVPFLQIVLKGSMDYYAPYANQGFYTRESILKMLEYGCYPSFMVTDSDNYSLTGTPLEDYFSLNFEDWRSEMSRIYQPLNEALSCTEGQFITEHRVLLAGVYRISYDAGTVIYVNYNSSPYTDGNITVPAQDFCVERKQP